MLNIFQFSVPRSGSTLIVQLMRELLPNAKILKTHDPCISQKVVISIRDFRDCLLSNWRVFNNISEKEIEQGRQASFSELEPELNNIVKFCKNLNKTYKYNSDKLILRYEEFVEDHDIIYYNLEKFLNITISTGTRCRLSAKYSIHNNKKRSKRFKTFDEWDRYGIHGKHVHNGKCGAWIDLAEEDAHDHITNKLLPYLKRWGYVS